MVLSGSLRVRQKAKSLKEFALKRKVIYGVFGKGKVAYRYEEVLYGFGGFRGETFLLAISFIGAGEGFGLKGRVGFELRDGEAGFFRDEEEIFSEVAPAVFYPAEEAPPLWDAHAGGLGRD